MDSIESYMWLFCLDHLDIKITKDSNFIEWIFVTDNIIFPKGSYRYTSHVVFQWGHMLTGIINFILLVPRLYILPNFTRILTATLLQCYARLGRCHGALGVPAATLWCINCDARTTCFRSDLTALVLRMLEPTSSTLETLLWYAALSRRSMRSHNDPAAISGNLTDFADHSEVTVMCERGINERQLNVL